MGIRVKRFLAVFLTMSIVLGIIPGWGNQVCAANSESSPYMRFETNYNNAWYSDPCSYRIWGIIDGSDIKTTYNNDGWRITLKNSANQTVFVGKIGNGIEKVVSLGGVNFGFTQNLSFVRNGRFIKVEFAVRNLSDTEQVISIASGADIQIGDADDAPIYQFPDGSGFYMTDEENAQFIFIGKNDPDVTDVDTFWYGYYYDVNANMFNQISQKSLTKVDSGMAFAWNNRTIAPGATEKYSVLIGVSTLTTIELTGIFAPESTLPNVYAGASFTVTGKVSNNYNIPGIELYYIIDNREPVRFYTFTGAPGNFTAAVNIPEGLKPGSHTIYIYAKDIDGVISPFIMKSFTVLRELAGHELTYMSGQGPVLLNPDFTINYTGTIIGGKIYIESNFNSETDSLHFENVYGITGSYNSQTGVLSLSGETSAENYQAFIRTVSFYTTAESGTRTVVIILYTGSGEIFYYTVNGHYYEYVAAPGITWTDAKAAAEARTYGGLTGYLATITSAAENAFVATKCAGYAWLGGSDAGHHKEWYWVTGPEAGSKFCQESIFGGVEYTEEGWYQNFAPGEPDNGIFGGEDYLYMYPIVGTWNDSPNYTDYIQGFMVEYGTEFHPPADWVSLINITIVDKIPPTIHNIAGIPSAWTNEDVTLTISASDAGSGLNVDGAYSFNYGEWTNIPSQTFTRNQTVNIRVRDNSGNIAWQDVVIDKIDKDPPTFINIAQYPESWTTSGPVTLIVNGLTDNSGVGLHAEPYSFSTTEGVYNWQSSNISEEFYENQTVYVYVRDALGNISTASTVFISNIDTTMPNAPVINLASSYTPSNWYNTDITVTASFVPTPGCAERLQYQINSGPWVDGSEVVLTVSGIYTISFRVIDELERTSSVQSCTVQIDKQSPTVSVSDTDYSWRSADFEVPIQFSDEGGSGVNSMQYALTNSTALPASWTDAAVLQNVPITEEGQWYIHYKAVDAAGNTLTGYYGPYKLDKSLPAISVVTGNPTGWTQNDVTLTVNASDSISGIAAYSFDGGATWQPENTKTYTQNESDIIIKVKDAAGNIRSFGPISITKIDKTSPETAVVTNRENYGDDIWHNASQAINATFMPTSGCYEKLQYRINSGDWTDGDTVNLTEEGNYTVAFRVIDEIGRASQEQNVIVNLDKTAPTNIEAQYGTNYFKKFLNTMTFGLFFKDTVTVTLSADDNLSGIKEFTYSVAGKEAKTIAANEGKATFTIEPQFKGNFSVTVMDNAGNSTQVHGFEYLAVDNDVPTAPAIDSGSYIPGTWAVDDVVLTVSESTALSGITKYQFTVTDEETLTGSEVWTDIISENGTVNKTGGTATEPPTVISASITVTDTCNVYYHFRAVSNSGINGAVKTIAVKIDKVAPAISVNLNGYNGEWTKDNVRFDFSNEATSISGISYYYSIDNGENWYPVSNTTYHEITSDTNCTYLFKAVSGVGFENISEGYIVRVQKTAPQNATVAISPATATGDNGWYKNTNGTKPTITITPPAVSGTAPVTTNYKLWAGDEPSDGTVFNGNQPVLNSDGIWNLKVWTEDAAGNRSAELLETIKVDTAAPTGTISIKDNPFKQFINAITFGLFFKQNVDISITADADLSGIAKIEYYKSASELSQSQIEALKPTDWIQAATFSVAQNEKFIVYARLTDNAGNVSVINSQGVVVYTDSDISEDRAYFDTDKSRSGYKDITVNLELNGNTLESVKLGSTILEEGTHYTVDGNKVTLKKEYLKTVVNGTVTFTFTFAPMGERFEDGTSIGDTPETKTFTITHLIHAQAPAFVSDLSGSKIYSKGDRADALNVEASVADGGEISYQWYVNGTAIAGATGKSYTPDTDKTGVYDYYVVATNTNASANGDKTATTQSGTYRVVINNATVNEPDIADEAPKTDIQEDEQEILDAVLTAEDQSKLENGYDITVKLKVQVVTTPPKNDEDAVYQIIGDNTFGQFIDISLIKTLVDAEGNKTEQKITQLNKPLTIIIDISENLLPKGGETRKFSIIRIQNGVATVLEDLDDVLDKITIQTDRISTYAIVYKTEPTDIPVNDGIHDSNIPDTSDTPTSVAYAMLSISALLLAISLKRRKKCN